jgi:hypothetical protein
LFDFAFHCFQIYGTECGVWTTQMKEIEQEEQEENMEAE